MLFFSNYGNFIDFGEKTITSPQTRLPSTVSTTHTVYAHELLLLLTNFILVCCLRLLTCTLETDPAKPGPVKKTKEELRTYTVCLRLIECMCQWVCASVNVHNYVLTSHF